MGSMLEGVGLGFFAWSGPWSHGFLLFLVLEKPIGACLEQLVHSAPQRQCQSLEAVRAMQKSQGMEVHLSFANRQMCDASFALKHNGQVRCIVRSVVWVVLR